MARGCRSLFGSRLSGHLWHVVGETRGHRCHRSGAAQYPALLIKSTPPGAHVYAGEDDLGVTPIALNPEEGLPVIYQLRLPGYKHLEIEHTATHAKPAEFDLTLEATRLPQMGERWTNSLGMGFKPAPGGHLSV